MIVKIENVEKRFIPVFEELAKSIQAKYFFYEEKTSMKKALEEVKNGECEVFASFEDYQKAMHS